MAMSMEVGSPAYEERMDALMAVRLAQPLIGDPSGHFTTLEACWNGKGTLTCSMRSTATQAKVKGRGR